MASVKSPSDKILKLSTVAVVAIVASTMVSPRLVWNASASAPMGLYFVAGESFTRGDLVLATAPDDPRKLANARGYLPATVPLVKRVAAMSGDQICADGDQILINGTVVAARLKTDSEGRLLPVWSGCHVLDHQVFLLIAGVSGSFDGRYFGAIPTTAVIGRLLPLWTY